MIVEFERRWCETIGCLSGGEEHVFVCVGCGGIFFGAESLAVEEVEAFREGYVFTEGPLWLAEEGKWIFSDVRADTIYDSKGERHLKPSKNINGLAPDMVGVLLDANL